METDVIFIEWRWGPSCCVEFEKGSENLTTFYIRKQWRNISALRNYVVARTASKDVSWHLTYTATKQMSGLHLFWKYKRSTNYTEQSSPLQADSHWAGKSIYNIVSKPKVHFSAENSPSQDPVLLQMDPAHTLTYSTIRVIIKGYLIRTSGYSLPGIRLTLWKPLLLRLFVLIIEMLFKDAVRDCIFDDP
jgi:hypothetical protein